MSGWEPRGDLHAHSVCSDGTATPEETVREADLKGVAWFSLTDHDTVAGIAPALSELARIGSPVELITGAELTCYDRSGREWHMLAYGFDHEDPRIHRFLEDRVRERETRVVEMTALLRSHGVGITEDDIRKTAGEGVVGRLHVAKALCRAGECASVPEAFSRWLVEGAPGYVPKPVIRPDVMVREIHSWGGVAVIAHPVQFDGPEDLGNALESGADGLEAYHPSVDRPLRKLLKKTARQRGLLITGGGDSHGHGWNRPRIGEVTVPAHFVEALLERISERRRAKTC